ncbi:Kinetochore-associated protein 1 [Blyttiomyces sp. JEL0837]|nr:Kinetochore-associated protein 1 [Blyttiomyces sp. JEL0837]
MEKAMKSLLNLNEKTRLHTLHRVRAMCALFKYSTPEDFNSSGVNFEDAKQNLQVLLYMVDFEDLRIAMTVKEFIACDKEGFARSLWAVQLICNICLDYKIMDTSLWENALNRLLKLDALRYLLGLLEHITACPSLSQIRSLPQIWNEVLMRCLRLVLDTKEFTTSLYDRTLSLLQKCPFVPDLLHAEFLDLFMRYWSRLKSPTIEEAMLILRGLSCLPPVPEMFQALRTVTRRLTADTAVQVLKKLAITKLDGMDTLELARVRYMFDLNIGKDWISHAIYERLDDLRQFELLEKSGHVQKCIRHLIAIDRLSGLLIAMVKGNKLEEAENVAQLYFQYWPDKKKGDLAEMSGLEAFLTGCVPDLREDDKKTVQEYLDSLTF